MKIKDADFSSNSVQQISYVGGKPIDHLVAVVNQTGDIYPTDNIEVVRQYLTVTAVYEDNSTGIITNYRLSGNLSVGYSTITISYGGFKTTVVVEVSVAAQLLSIDATFTQGTAVIYNIDSLDVLRDYLVVVANYEGGLTRTLDKYNYNLIGALVVGTSTITVEYGGETDTFTVTVTEKVTDPDAAAYCEEVGITDQTTIDKVSEFVGTLKRGLVWDKIESIFPFMGSDATTMLVNLKNPDAVYPESCLVQKNDITDPITVKTGCVNGKMIYYLNYLTSELQQDGFSLTFRLSQQTAGNNLDWLSCVGGSSQGSNNGYVIFKSKTDNTLQARANATGYDATTFDLNDVPSKFNYSMVVNAGVPVDVYVDGTQPTYLATSGNSICNWGRANYSSNPIELSCGYGSNNWGGDIYFFAVGKALTSTEADLFSAAITALKG